MARRMTPDFLILDKNSDGLINKSETLGYFKAVYDEKFDAGAAEGFFKGMDSNSNGVVNKKSLIKIKKRFHFSLEGQLS